VFRDLAYFVARNTPRSAKALIARNRILQRFTHRTLARALGNEMSVRSGPMRGLVLNVSEHTLSSHISGTYEQRVQTAIDERVKPGDVCYDLGASIGYFTMLMAKKAQWVYAFEPAPHAAEEIRRNLRASQLQNVTVVGDPVSDTKKEVRFTLTDVAYGSRINDGETKWPVLKLTSLTLDEFTESNPAPDFIKIDVEGEEGKVLRGAPRLLAQKRPVLCCELHSPEVADEVHDILLSHRYTMTNLNGAPFHPAGGPWRGEVHVIAYPAENTVSVGA
jgi:FkbM family methyltransferase